VTTSAPQYTRGKHPNSRKRPSNNIDVVLSRCIADLVTDCVLYTGTQHPNGYCYVSINSVATKVHRYVYEQLVGPIPTDLALDHLCGVKCCVNPDHLEPVTFAENTRRYWEGRRG
jgi:hypothetical protein